MLHVRRRKRWRLEQYGNHFGCQMHKYVSPLFDLFCSAFLLWRDQKNCLIKVSEASRRPALLPTIVNSGYSGSSSTIRVNLIITTIGFLVLANLHGGLEILVWCSIKDYKMQWNSRGGFTERYGITIVFCCKLLHNLMLSLDIEQSFNAFDLFVCLSIWVFVFFRYSFTQ